MEVILDYDVVRGYGDARYKQIEERITDKSRQSLWYEYIILDTITNKYYRGCVEVGATEMQEVDKNPIECQEVHQVERTMKVWEVVND